ncbi:MAG: M20/M25/M40 family metallo-hydrolase [Clostridiales bacterium]|nr:M20/M25/M40 family metallo-hydrolase [Clostridiales bacterium]
MVALYILSAVAAVLIVLFAVSAVRAVLVKKELPKGAAVAEGAESGYAERLARLIRFETVSEKVGEETDKFERYYEVVRATYPEVFRHAERIRVGRSLLLRIRGDEASLAPILLMAHADVVEVTPDGWKYPPYSGEIAEGKIWGRGTLDTKGAFAAYLSALGELLSEGKRPRRTVYLLATPDEEIFGGGAAEACEYFKEKGIRFYTVIDEGGVITDGQLPGVKCGTAMFGVVEKGQGNIEFIARSAGGHSAMPPKNTPLARLGALMADVDKKHPFPVRFSPELRRMFRDAAPYAVFPMRLVFANLWLFAPLVKLLARKIPALYAMLTTTIVFTKAAGSEMYNVIPDKATAVANVRYIGFCQGTEVRKVLEKKLKKRGIETNFISEYEYSEITSTETPAYLELKARTEEYFGVPVIPYIMTGMTHSRYLYPVSDAVIRFTPFKIDKEQLKSIHGKNECLEVSSLTKAVGFFKKYLKEI